MTRSLSLGAALAALLLVVAPLSAEAAKPFTAHLSGSEMVPARETNAKGQAKFDVSSDLTQVSFRLNVSSIENVIAAHIYRGAPGENGQIVATLYGPVAAGAGRQAGVLAQGTLTATNLVGEFAGQPLTSLIDAMKAGSTYVAVLTDDGLGGPDERPGDFSSGEIRGQIR